MIIEAISAIEARLIAALQADPVLYDPSNPDPTKRGLTSPSAVAIWRNLLNTIATEVSLMENTMGIFETEVENIISLAAPGTPSWMQAQVFKFQYDDSVAQVAQLINFVVQYPVVDATKQIITQCAIVTSQNKVVQVKVAINSTPLTSLEQLALASYLDMMNFAGVIFTIISVNPDQLYIGADITYNGQYAPTIQASVIAAIQAFLATSNIENFNGVLLVSKIEDIIQAVPGVLDVTLNNVWARLDAGAVGDTKLVNASDELLPSYQPYSGYMVPETTSGYQLTDTGVLNFIPQ